MTGSDEKQNVTLALPKRLLRRLKVVAAERETSVSAILTQLLQEYVARQDDYEQAMRRSIAAMKRGYDLGTNGKIPWRRDELHER